MGQISDLFCIYFFGAQRHLAKLLPLVAIVSATASRHAIQDMVWFSLDHPEPGTRLLLTGVLEARPWASNGGGRHKNNTPTKCPTRDSRAAVASRGRNKSMIRSAGCGIGAAYTSAHCGGTDFGFILSTFFWGSNTPGKTAAASRHLLDRRLPPRHPGYG